MADNFSGKIDKYDLPIDFTKCRSVCIERRWMREDAGDYLGGIDSDGHERKDNYAPTYDKDTVMFKYNEKTNSLVRHSGYDEEEEVSVESALSEIERHLDTQRDNPDYSMRIYDDSCKSRTIDAAKQYARAQEMSKRNDLSNRFASTPSMSVPEVSEPDCDYSRN